MDRRSAGPTVGVFRPGPAERPHRLRPLATFEIVDQATAFWRRRLGTVLAVTLACTLPVQALAAAACRSQRSCAGVRPTVFSAVTAGTSSNPALVLALAVLGALAGQVAAAAVALIVAAEQLGYPLPAGRALRSAVRRAGPVAVAWLLGHLLLAVSALTVVGPVLVMTFLLVTTPALAIEGLGPVAGLRRSWRLGRARFWPLLGVALASGLVASLLGLAFSALPSVLSAVGPLTRWGWLLRAAATQLQVLVGVPLTAAATTLAYLDVRVRVEGLDLQVDAERAFAPREVRPALAR